MYHPFYKAFTAPRWSAQFLLAAGVGVFLGVACVAASPLWVLAGLVCISCIILMFKRPEFILLALLVVTSTIFHASQNPGISLGVGTVYLTDILLMLGISIIALRWLIEPDFHIVRTPLDIPLLGFVGLAIISTILAIAFTDLTLQETLGMMRVVFHYLCFFLVTQLIRTQRQLVFLLDSLTVLALVVAGAMLLQFMVGESLPFLPGRIETLRTQGVNHQGITRILIPGMSLVLTLFIFTTTNLILDRLRWSTLYKAACWIGFALAVLLTFNRNFWVASGLSLIIVLVLSTPQERWRAVGYGLSVVMLAGIVLVPLSSDPDSRAARLTYSAYERLSTLIEDDTLQESSLQFRYIENKYAYEHLTPPDLIGSGLGANYRPWVSLLDWEEYDGRNYIHNAHFWIIIQIGLMGYICLMFTIGVLFWRSFMGWRTISNIRLQTAVLAFALTHLGVLIGSIVNPMLMQWYWTPLLGFMFGFTEVSLRQARAPEAHASQHTDVRPQIAKSTTG
jgi:hypothetical protein